ncbi:MAG: hypothetical protein PHF37_10695 [Phycisphaerae bacterium]|nr:hypothetical protein [Phycisphaerae bacterium]
MKADAKKLARTAQQPIVEVKPASGSPPSYPSTWKPLWDAKVDIVEINAGSRPSKAVIWFPSLYYHQPAPLKNGDMVRIRTAARSVTSQTVIFTGFVTSNYAEFFGSRQDSQGYERNAVVALDFRWLLNKTNIVFGQVVRGPDDYDGYGTTSQIPIIDSYTWLSGRRAIFNENGYPNRDAEELQLTNPYNTKALYEIPIWAAASNKTETSAVKYWNVRQMVRAILSPLYNWSFTVFSWLDVGGFYGLAHEDWDKVLHHICIDGLNAIEALELICHQIGWSFRQADIVDPGSPWFDFYKVGRAAGYRRTIQQSTILHQLYSPKPNEHIRNAVARGEKMVHAGSFSKDISSLINEPWSLGFPDRFEFTAELVPAWLDTDFEPQTGEDCFLTQVQLQALEDPNTKDFYKYYHAQGSAFKRPVGRKWALNEAGDYSNEPYGRGSPFAFESVIPERYLIQTTASINRGRFEKKIKRLYAPYRRQLLSCLSLDKDSLNSLGIHVQFSFDSGQTWQVIPARISSLPDEAGLYIEEENLAEMLDPQLRTISGGPLNDVELNYYTSIADDKLNTRSFTDKQWRTRVRITASVQLDQRLVIASRRVSTSGSLFEQRAVYDFSNKHGLAYRCPSSIFMGPAATMDSQKTAQTHLDAIRDANQDISICGQFTLDRLWLDDNGEPVFQIGDCVERLNGRNYSLAANFAGPPIYPEIVQIVYMFEQQQTKLITRDLRFAEVRLV